jgi:hypothetical protein
VLPGVLDFIRSSWWGHLLSPRVGECGKLLQVHFHGQLGLIISLSRKVGSIFMMIGIYFMVQVRSATVVSKQMTIFLFNFTAQ